MVFTVNASTLIQKAHNHILNVISFFTLTDSMSFYWTSKQQSWTTPSAESICCYIFSSSTNMILKFELRKFVSLRSHCTLRTWCDHSCTCTCFSLLQLLLSLHVVPPASHLHLAVAAACLPLVYHTFFFSGSSSRPGLTSTVYSNTSGCSEPLGMKSRLVLDRQITASSTFRTWGLEAFTWQPHYARLDKQGKTNAWTAATNDRSEWLQVGEQGRPE